MRMDMCMRQSTYIQRIDMERHVHGHACRHVGTLVKEFCTDLCAILMDMCTHMCTHVNMCKTCAWTCICRETRRDMC